MERKQTMKTILDALPRILPSCAIATRSGLLTTIVTLSIFVLCSLFLPSAAAATSDFDGNGTGDVVLAKSDGTTAIALMNGISMASTVPILSAGNWTVTHVADFNGDGKADLLWRHTDGSVAMWIMNGVNLASSGIVLGAGTGWTVSHVADFNGDGKADLLWRNTDGSVAMWLMNGLTPAIGGIVLGAGTGWTVSHGADFNGDGKADLLWRNTDSSVAMWLMNGLTLTSGGGILGSGSGWSVTHTRDLNGDGRADILLKNNDGSTYAYLMNGSTVTVGGFLTTADSGWRVVPSLVDSGAIGVPTFRRIFGTADNCFNDTPTSNDPATVSDLNINQATTSIGFWGDAGTDELARAVSNPVTWNVEQLLNLTNPTRKVGYWDIGPPQATSAVVLKCNEAGFFLNTYQFNHTIPIRGGGPGAQVAKKTSFPQAMFSSDRNKFIIQGYIKHPYHHWTEDGAVGQITMFYYVQPLYCPQYFWLGGRCPAANGSNGVPAFAHLLGIYDSRYEGTYQEFVDNDTFTGFFSTPLADSLPSGLPPRFATPSSFSSRMARKNEIWNSARFFRAEIGFSQMQQMIDVARRDGAIASATTRNPMDWGIVLVGAQVETSPTQAAQCVRNTNTVGCRDVVMAATFEDIAAFELVEP
jgi:FG-GAP-like repeat